jgi:small subunit ribosomal protein S11
MVKRKSVWHKNIEKARKLMGKYSKKESEASVYINCSFNNTIITITNKQGNTLFWSSGGTAGLKGSRRSTAHAAKKAAKQIGNSARKAGLVRVDLFLKGIGKGRYGVAKVLRQTGLKIQKITDITPIPFNGCRPPKKRRI